jgi:hypothetical protein
MYVFKYVTTVNSYHDICNVIFPRSWHEATTCPWSIEREVWRLVTRSWITRIRDEYDHILQARQWSCRKREDCQPRFTLFDTEMKFAAPARFTWPCVKSMNSHTLYNSDFNWFWFDSTPSKLGFNTSKRCWWNVEMCDEFGFSWDWLKQCQRFKSHKFHVQVNTMLQFGHRAAGESPRRM